jgi:hypothetical protein
VKKKSIIILVIFASSIVVWYRFSKNIEQKSPSVLSALTTHVQPIPTGSGKITSPQTWSRYSFNHDFTIAYPARWNVVVDKDGSTVDFMTTGFHQDDDFSMPYGNSDEVTYTIFGEHDTSDMSLKNGDQFPDDTTSEILVVTNFKHIKVAGYPAVEFDYYPTDNVHFMRTRISILKEHAMYRFDALYAQVSGKKLLEEMVQSLQFIHA